MKKLNEERILKVAAEILARREDALALRMAMERQGKVNLGRLVEFSAYYQGAMVALNVTKGWELEGIDGKDRQMYGAAVRQLVLQSKDHVRMFIEHDYDDIRFRGHVKTRNGRLTSVEAYFSRNVTVVEEIV